MVVLLGTFHSINRRELAELGGCRLAVGDRGDTDGSTSLVTLEIQLYRACHPTGSERTIHYHPRGQPAARELILRTECFKSEQKNRKLPEANTRIECSQR